MSRPISGKFCLGAGFPVFGAAPYLLSGQSGERRVGRSCLLFASWRLCGLRWSLHQLIRGFRGGGSGGRKFFSFLRRAFRRAPALCLSALHLFIRGVPGDGSGIWIFSSSSAAKDRLFRQTALDNYAKSGIIKTKSEPRTRLLLKSPLYDVAYSHTQPSLARVAVVLFALRFPDDDTHRILSNMKSKSHCTSPPFGRMEQPPARLCSLSTPVGAFLLYRNCRLMSIAFCG